MPSARVKLPDYLEGLLLSEMEEAIEQANLGKYDTQIAQRYLIEQVPQIDIAAEYGTHRSTISHHIARITKKVEETARRWSRI